MFQGLGQRRKKCICFLHITPAAHLAQGISVGMLHTVSHSTVKYKLFFMSDAFQSL